MTPEIKATLMRALAVYRGDDLERAKAAFQHCTAAEMNEEYGQSGTTRADLLAVYQQKRDDIEAAVAWVVAQ